MRVYVPRLEPDAVQRDAEHIRRAAHVLGSSAQNQGHGVVCAPIRGSLQEYRRLYTLFKGMPAQSARLQDHCQRSSKDVVCSHVIIALHRRPLMGGNMGHRSVGFTLQRAEVCNVPRA